MELTAALGGPVIPAVPEPKSRPELRRRPLSGRRQLRSRLNTLLHRVCATGSYATYFLIGLFLYGVLNSLKAFYLIADIIYYLAFGLCLVFAALSLRDAWVVRRGAEPKDMILRLPESLKTKLQVHMSRGVRAKGALFVAVLLTAGIVSLIESLCTGQVYFPVIAGMVRDTATRGQGLVLLAWYNLVFVVPLASVLALALFGVSSQRLASFSRKHLTWAKVGLAAAFVFMAVWMWSGMIWPPGRR